MHTSFRGARHQAFEANEGDEILDYERLEHVGDAILGAEVTLLIVKAALLSNQTLALISSRLGFPSQLKASAAQTCQLRTNYIVQASLFEAYLALLLIEKGHAAFQAFVDAIYAPLVPVVVEAFRSAESAAIATPLLEPANYVGMLMEWTQERWRPGRRTATFNSSLRSGLDHKPLWSISCEVEQYNRSGTMDVRVYVGFGSTVAEAKRECVGVSSTPQLVLMQMIDLFFAGSAAFQACVELGLA
ncbi:hypothetical protein JCM10295v2_004929 [Rhodotorula toruloides]